MSFQDKGFWMAEGGGNLSDGETVFNNSSRIENKRTYQWLNNADPETFSQKKQAIQVPVSKPTSGLPPAASLSWENVSGFQSATNQFTDRLFSSDATRSLNFTESISQHGIGNSNMGRTVTDEQFANESSVGLSISYPLEDSYGGYRKVKVNQVKDAENSSHAANEQNFDISLDQTFIRETEPAYISMRQPFSKEGGNVPLMGHLHNRVEANVTMDSSFSKADEHAMSLAQPFTKAEPSTISFGGYQDEPYINTFAKPVSSYDLLYNQASLQIVETAGGRELDASTTPVLHTPQAQKTKSNSSSTKPKSESKSTRKVEPPNSFPSNVRSLMATGMLDGVSVKYVSVSREELPGIIKGPSYLCGCQSCNFSKALNAFEFERHAGCKTKHPNNHIYFENGKTIYQIVQELKSTPESLLFDAIQTITGSQINQKAFRIWKESFQAATRELQRIYGKGELNL